MVLKMPGKCQCVRSLPATVVTSTVWLEQLLALVPFLVLIATMASPTAAQVPDIGVRIQPLTETDAAHPGTSARVALQMGLNPGFHVNSDTPLDDLLIPTALTLDVPEGFALGGVAYPEAILLEQVGAEEPLAVFEEEFLIGAVLELNASLQPGTYTVPGTLRYQACNDRMCFNPTNAAVQFEVAVAPPEQALNTILSLIHI